MNKMGLSISRRKVFREIKYVFRFLIAKKFMLLSFLVKRIIRRLLQISDMYGNTPLSLYYSHTTDHSNDRSGQK